MFLLSWKYYHFANFLEISLLFNLWYAKGNTCITISISLLLWVLICYQSLDPLTMIFENTQIMRTINVFLTT